jgi:hypothetical protein
VGMGFGGAIGFWGWSAIGFVVRSVLGSAIVFWGCYAIGFVSGWRAIALVGCVPYCNFFCSGDGLWGTHHLYHEIGALR